MDSLDLFFKKYSYKFNKGYPDMNNTQDVLLLETILKELGVNLILENNDLINILNKSGNFSEYGDISSSGKNTIELTFSNVPSTGAQSKQQRQEIYDLIKQISDKGGDISGFKKLPTGSSIGSAEIIFKGKPLKIVIKGTPGESSSDTDVKEALVSLFYITNIDFPFNQENYKDNFKQIRKDLAEEYKTGKINFKTLDRELSQFDLIEDIADISKDKNLFFGFQAPQDDKSKPKGSIKQNKSFLPGQ